MYMLRGVSIIITSLTIMLLFLNTIPIAVTNVLAQAPPASQQQPAPQFNIQSTRDLTGTYSSDDGGTYYVRQIGSNLLWVGMSSRGDGRTWTNVFIGTIQGDSVTGNWADVPRGSTQNSGTLALKIVTDPNGGFGFQKTSTTGAVQFGANTWQRIAAGTSPPSQAVPAAPPAAPPPPAAAPAAAPAAPKYIIRIDSIRVDEARSPSADTVYVSLAAKIGEGQPIPPQTKFMGDLGDRANPPVGIQVGPLDVPGTQALSFSYLVENKGGGGTSQTLLDMGRGAATMLTTPGIGAGVAAVQGILQRLVPGLFPGSCNGIVAADEIVLSKAQLEQMTSRGPHTQTKFYPGTDSPVGCGSNSRYNVMWTIIRAP